MIPVLLWWVLGAIVALIVGSAFFNFVKEKHTWVVLGDADSGKTEFLCLLQDMERDPKGEKQLSHAGGSTPNSGKTIVKVEVAEVLNQTIAFCDGPGAEKRKNSRFSFLLNGPVKDAIEKDQELILLYMIDMEKIVHNDQERIKACKMLLAEIGLFFRDLAQLVQLVAKEHPTQCKDVFLKGTVEEVVKEIVDAIGEVIVVGTHMDKVEALFMKSLFSGQGPIDSQALLFAKISEMNALKRTIDEKKMSVLISPFLKDVTFKFVFADLYNYRGRCGFLKDLGEVLKEKE